MSKNLFLGMRLRCTCSGHEDAIGRITWSPCGRFIASPSEDKTVRIWNAETGECLSILEGHKYSVYSVAWSPNGQLLATGSNNEGIHIWSAETYQKLTVLEVNEFGGEALDWSLDSNLLAVGCKDYKIRILEVATGQEVRVLRGHTGRINCLAWSPDGKKLASGGGHKDETIRVWNAHSGNLTHTLIGHTNYVNCIAWSPNSDLLVSGAGTGDSGIRLWDMRTGRLKHTMQGHTKTVTGLSFIAEGSLLASKSAFDGTIRLWNMFKFSEIACIPEDPASAKAMASLAFHKCAPVLATLGPENAVIRIWDLNLDVLLGVTSGSESIRYTSAKIVLVGESNVGKSCLAMRIAEGRYPNDHEQGTTHGMRFWPMEAEELHFLAKPPEGQRRDIVLWDMGGQDEYRLIHQLFLHDTTLALLFLDPTRGRAAFADVETWNKRLEKQLAGRTAVKLLVGSKLDEPSGIVDQTAIERLCQELGFADYIETSALRSRGIDELKEAIAKNLDWNSLAATTRPKLFQRIGDEIKRQREAGEVVLPLETLKGIIRAADPEDYDDGAVIEVAGQLATQGVIAQTQRANGEQVLVLQLPVIERYAGSLILAARNNPRLVPALEERQLGSPQLSLPGMEQEGMAKNPRLPREQERIVLECVVQLLVSAGICFRHEALLIFPSLFRATETTNDDELVHGISLYYDFSGAIDNVYASLIAWLVIGANFGQVRLWEKRVEFSKSDQSACGLRKVDRGSGFAHLDVYFHDSTSEQTKKEFIGFVHDHLRRHDIEVIEHFEFICPDSTCRYEIPRDVVQSRMARGESKVKCPICETEIKLSEGIRQERSQDEAVEIKTFGLLTRVENSVPQIVAQVKARAFGRSDDQFRTNHPIRILHLSDLHFTSDTSVDRKVQWLVDDIEKGKWLDDNRLDYLVISGDVTDKGNTQGFENARQFVSLLIDKFELSAQRCIFVPGNHDVQDLDEAYSWQINPPESKKREAIQEGRLYGLPTEKYKDRLKAFSSAFYHPILQKPYPLVSENQGLVYTFPETKIQFLTLNSCWQIDQFHRRRASIHPDAVAKLIREADNQIDRAIENTDLIPRDYLRIGVWHHAVKGRSAMENLDFLDHLQNNQVKLCLNGDVHEMRREVIRHWHKDQIHIVGAGSFGSLREGLPDSTPRLYNLIEVQRDLASVRIHTRRQPIPDGAWDGWYEWPDDGGNKRVSYFDIELS